eukprot:748309-Hanusia_phi.AAC.13
MSAGRRMRPTSEVRESGRETDGRPGGEDWSPPGKVLRGDGEEQRSHRDVRDNPQPAGRSLARLHRNQASGGRAQVYLTLPVSLLRKGKNPVWRNSSPNLEGGKARIG